MKHTGVHPRSQIISCQGEKIFYFPSMMSVLNEIIVQNSILLLQSPLFSFSSTEPEGMTEPEPLSTSFKSLMISSDFSDIAFLLEDNKVVHAHKVIVARSPYLCSMISNGMKESHQELILLKDISSDVFLSILHYLYTDTLPEQSQDHVIELLAISNLYLMYDLKFACEIEIAKALTFENVSEVFCHARLHNANKLQQECLRLVKQNAVQLSQRKVNLPEDLQKEVNQIIQDRMNILSISMPLDYSIRTGNLTVNVQSLIGRIYVLKNLTEDMTINELMLIIEMESEIEVESQRLIFGGRQLYPTTGTLADYRITNNSTVNLVYRLYGA